MFRYASLVICVMMLLSLLCSCSGDSEDVPLESVSQLHGLKCGSIVGTLDEKIIKVGFSDNEVSSFNTNSDALSALLSKKIDFFFTDESAAVLLTKSTDGITYLKEDVYPQHIAMMLSKTGKKSAILKKQMNEFIDNNADMIADIVDRWMYHGEDQKAPDTVLTGENGVLRIATPSAVPPYVTIVDGKNAGIDIEIVTAFCSEYGYKMEINIYDISGIIPAVVADKVDISLGGFSITPERLESVDFINSYSTESSVAIVRSIAVSESFIESMISGFEKTFIREDRWKLILDGVVCTVVISAASIIASAIGGFALYMLSRKGNKAINRILNYLSGLFDGLPLVVLLMLLFYVVFSKSSISGELVAVIGFSVCFAFSVYSMLSTAVMSVDSGQTEGSYSLGLTDNQTFFGVVLPQAVPQFLPGYKSLVNTLLKGTAIVGYIGVQDLTKMTDIIRGITFEAFFPVVVSALMYLWMGRAMTFIINRIEFAVNPENRTQEQIIAKYTKNNN